MKKRTNPGCGSLAPGHLSASAAGLTFILPTPSPILLQVDNQIRANPSRQLPFSPLAAAAAVLLLFATAVCAEVRVTFEHNDNNQANPAFHFTNEIDVVDSNTPATDAAPSPTNCVQTIDIAERLYQITIDTSDSPDLTEWTKTELAPVVREWYPKLAKLLPSDGFAAPQQVTVRFSESLRGVAETSGTRIRCAARWFRSNLKGEAIGSVVHELVHVVQQYGAARRGNPDATRSPGWLVEGLADYLRWFLYEPQSHGADVTWLRQRGNIRLRYDAGYRLTANFLNWIVEKHDKDIVQHLNAAMRQGKYREEIWKERTGRTLQDLGAEWKQELEQQLEPPVHTPSP